MYNGLATITDLRVDVFFLIITQYRLNFGQKFIPIIELNSLPLHSKNQTPALSSFSCNCKSYLYINLKGIQKRGITYQQIIYHQTLKKQHIFRGSLNTHTVPLNIRLNPLFFFFFFSFLICFGFGR